MALSEVVGRRPLGENLFAEIPQKYNALKDSVVKANLSAPKVMVNAPYGDIWSMPPTQSYAVQLITDAGGDYIYKNNSGNSSTPIDLEEAYQLVSETDVWVNTGTTISLEELRELCPKFTDTRCFIEGKVYNNNLLSNAAGGNGYFESGVVNPDIILRDLIKIFHPELVNEDFVYYRQLK